MWRQFLHVATWVVLVFTSCAAGQEPANSPEQTASARQPVPSDDVLMPVVSSLQRLFGSDYERATRSGGKQDLARKLLAAAAATQNEPISKYAALVEARRLAQEVGDVATTFKSIELLTAEYDLAPLTEKTAAIVLLGNAGRSMSTIRELSKELLPTLEAAVAADDFHSANRIHPVAVELARKRGDKSLLNRLDRIKVELDGLELQFSDYEEAKETLVENPRDTSANRTVGLYLGLRKDRWQEGEQHIILAKDELLQSLFARQCSPPTAAVDQGTLADAWWDWSYLQKGISRVQAQVIAVSWYKACQSGLAGLARARADERLKLSSVLLNVRLPILAVAAADPAAAATAAAASAERAPIGETARQARKSASLLSHRDQVSIAKGSWEFRDHQLTYNDPRRDGVVRLKSRAPGDFRIVVEATPSNVTRATRISLGFQRANRDFAIQLSHDSSCILTDDDGLKPIGQPKHEPVWVPEGPNVVSYEVDGETLSVVVNGAEFLTYKARDVKDGEASNFSLEVVGIWKISRLDFDPDQ